MSQGEIKLEEPQDSKRTRTLSSGLIITAPSEGPSQLPKDPLESEEDTRRVISPTSAYPSSATLSPPAFGARKTSGDSRGSSHSDLGRFPRALSITTISSSDIFSRSVSTTPEELNHRELVLSAIRVNNISETKTSGDLAIPFAISFISELPREEIKKMQIQVNAYHCCTSFGKVSPGNKSAYILYDFAEKYLNEIQNKSSAQFNALHESINKYEKLNLIKRARGPLRALYEYLQKIEPPRPVSGQEPAVPTPTKLVKRNSV